MDVWHLFQDSSETEAVGGDVHGTSMAWHPGSWARNSSMEEDPFHWCGWGFLGIAKHKQHPLGLLYLLWLLPVALE